MKVPTRVLPFPRSRRVIVDIGRVTSQRATIHGLLEADVTIAWEKVRAADLSFTAYVVATLARAVAEHPHVHAVRDLRGRLVIFDQVDVAVSIEVELEGRSFPLTHVVRAAEALTVSAITGQIRSVKSTPSSSSSLQHDRAAQAFVAMPGIVRRLLLRLLYRLPDRQRRIMGTVGVSSIGMFGEGGGYGIALPVHSVDVLVGGLAEEVRRDSSNPAVRRLLSISLSFDHDVVDGAPATRFAARFREMLASGEALTR